MHLPGQSYIVNHPVKSNYRYFHFYLVQTASAALFYDLSVCLTVWSPCCFSSIVLCLSLYLKYTVTEHGLVASLRVIIVSDSVTNMCYDRLTLHCPYEVTRARKHIHARTYTCAIIFQCLYVTTTTPRSFGLSVCLYTHTYIAPESRSV